METCVFQPADILLPADVDMNRWSVIACDQFTSDADYWRQVEAIVCGAPSTLRLMLPEYYLGKCDEAKAAASIQSTMRAYLERGLFRTVAHSFIYLERTLPGGTVRRGLIGAVDLEKYDYSPCSCSAIRATEDTVEDRLPPRVKVRAEAALEMPHIMLFFNDVEDRIMQNASLLSDATLYDFDLMLGGGHVVGKRISGQHADALAQALETLPADGAFRYAVGDGNHSLAAARKFWLKRRECLDPSSWEDDPARYALVELVNIHDPAITFEPIHRVLFHTNTEFFFDAAEKVLSASNGEKTITLIANGETRSIRTRGNSIGSVIGNVEAFCQAYLSEYGGEIDYIHGEEETRALAGSQGAVGILLPYMEKNELFSSVEKTGPFPKKSFSIGLGPDKRYYLECRRLS